MPHISHTTRRRMAFFFAALLVCALSYFLPSRITSIHNLSTILYTALLTAWGVSIYRRTLQYQVRRWFLVGAGMLILMFLLRLLRYNTSEEWQTAERYLWYAYYIPMTAVPMAALGAALHMGREESASSPRSFHGLWAAWLLLVSLILTNDLHGWMFRFADTPGGGYSYGWLYIVTFGWIAVISGISFAVLMRRCRLSQCRRLWFVPVLAALPGVVLLSWYIACGGNAPTLLGQKLYNFQEAYSILFVFVWESCMQIGLILCNTDYEAIFSLLPLDAFLTGSGGEVLYRSKIASIPSGDKLTAARIAPVSVDEDHVLHSNAIHGGAVYWIEDISAVNRLNSQIASAIEYLEDEQSLLAEEARIRAEKTSYETQNRLYDGLSPLVQPQLATAERLISAEGEEDEDAFREHLTHAMVLCVYAKRRVNLALLASKSDTLDMGELELAVQETLEYLRLRGVVCSMERLGAPARLPAADLLLLYDFFASAVEAALPGLSALFVLVHREKDYGIDLSMSAPTAPLAPHWRMRQRERSGAEMLLSEDEGMSHARLRFCGEGRT